ncbi:MAG: type II secretion system protein [Meiothermus sp.]|nr:type II secretion system protein [Meiothermus sp.]
MLKPKGLTVIEILIAITILGALLAASSGALATMFNTSKNARGAVSDVTVARNLIETVRQQWSGTAGRGAFDANCVRVTLPAGASVSVFSTASDGALGSALTASIIDPAATCATANANAAGTVKRVIVATNRGGNETARLTLDLVRP